MEQEKLNYEEDVHIDPMALDLECLAQPDYVMKYTRHQAWCEKERDRLKFALELVKAELDREIRTNPENYGIVKITEGCVFAVLLIQDKYKNANEELLEAQYELTMAKGVVAAFQDRKSMLETLVKLHGQNYFAGPTIPRNLSDEVQKRKEEREAKEKKDEDMNKRISSKLKRN